MLKIVGKKQINNSDVVVIEGGFGLNSKVLLDTQIADIHNLRNIRVREMVNIMINRGRFKENIDYIDLKKDTILNDSFFLNEFYSKMELVKAKSIFILSERGYTKLIKMFNDDKSWDIMEQIVDEYFTMRAVLNSEENRKKELLLQLFSNDPLAIATAHKELMKIEIKPLEDKIQQLQPRAEKYNIFLDSEGLTDIDSFSKQLAITGFGRNNIYSWLRANKYLQDGAKKNIPYAKYVNTNPLFVVKNTGFRLDRQGNRIPTVKTFLTSKGVDFFIGKFVNEGILQDVC